MTQDNEKILLKVLSEQLSYGVLILDTAAEKYGKLYQINPDFVWYDCQETGDVECQTIFNVKPYLFPLSSMTEEERKELEGIFNEYDNPCTVDEDGCLYFYGGNDFLSPEDLEIYIDFFNKHHIDYRGLIEKGLAIDATGLNIY